MKTNLSHLDFKVLPTYSTLIYVVCFYAPLIHDSFLSYSTIMHLYYIIITTILDLKKDLLFYLNLSLFYLKLRSIYARSKIINSLCW